VERLSSSKPFVVEKDRVGRIGEVVFHGVVLLLANRASKQGQVRQLTLLGL